MCARVWLVFALASGLMTPAVWAQGSAPKADDKRVSALYRTREEWKVTTTVTLTAKDEDGDAGGTDKWTFEVLNPAALKTANGKSRLNCLDPTTAQWSGPAVKFTVAQLSIICEYEPPVAFAGEDTFQYRVSDSASPAGVSPPATVSIDVKSQGLRWEFTTGAGQTLSSDTPQGEGLPDIFGKTAQDFLMTLDWVIRQPTDAVTAAVQPAATSGSAESPIPDEPLHERIQRDMHLAIRTGLVTKAEAVTATPVTDTAGNPVAGAPSEEATAGRRKFTAGGEFNYNWVLPWYGTGAFVELGGMARGNLDVAVDTDDDFEKVAGRLVKLARTGKGVGSFRGEVGMRVTLKQYRQEMFQMKRQAGPGQPMDTTATATTSSRSKPGFSATRPSPTQTPGRSARTATSCARCSPCSKFRAHPGI